MSDADKLSPVGTMSDHDSYLLLLIPLEDGEVSGDEAIVAQLTDDSASVQAAGFRRLAGVVDTGVVSVRYGIATLAGKSGSIPASPSIEMKEAAGS